MTLIAMVTFFCIMVALAATPSASVALVVTRSATHGLPNGAAATLGIVVADLVFVALAMLGMTAVAETMGGFFVIIRCVAGAYLIWLGAHLIWSRKVAPIQTEEGRPFSLATSFLSGLFLTFGDLKAIFFYASLFPALFDLRTLGPGDLLLIASGTVITVGGVKLTYAIAANRVLSRFQNNTLRARAKTAAGGLLMGTGAVVILK